MGFEQSWWYVRDAMGAALFNKGLGCCQKDRLLLFVYMMVHVDPHYLFGCYHDYSLKALMCRAAQL